MRGPTRSEAGWPASVDLVQLAVANVNKHNDANKHRRRLRLSPCSCVGATLFNRLFAWSINEICFGRPFIAALTLACPPNLYPD